MTGPANNSTQAISSYIQEYLDPQGNLSCDDDPSTVVAQLDEVFAGEGGAGVDAEQMARYLETLSR